VLQPPIAFDFVVGVDAGRVIMPPRRRRTPILSPFLRRSALERVARSASACFLLGLPAGGVVAVAVAIVLGGPAAREAVARVLCHLLTSGAALAPTLVVLVNGFGAQNESNPVVQICAVHMIWNAHLVAPCVAFYPFLIHAYATGATYAEVLYDATCFFAFVCAPVVMATGAVKGVASRRRERFGWRHRAILGVACLFVFGCYFAGTCWVRAASVPATLAASAGFYVYAFTSYLPPQPQGDGPEISGAREWPALKEFLRPFLLAPVERYLGLDVVLDAPAAKDGDAAAAAALRKAERAVRAAVGHLSDVAPTAEVRRLSEDLSASAALVGARAAAEASGRQGALTRGEAVIVGFHPHGIIPFVAALMTLSPAWKKRVAPALERVVVCTDAFTHVVPWMRDLGQWLGGRECTREAIGRALGEGTSVVLVPGGQAEIFSTTSSGNTVRVYRGHRGFVRLALQEKARLAPAFSFGEWELMDNVSAPSLQRWTKRRIGFPFPFWPYGRWGLPLPRRPPKGVTVVVGEPVDFPLAGPVDEAAVAGLHARYFDALAALFERHKAAAGYPDHVLVFDDGDDAKTKTR